MPIGKGILATKGALKLSKIALDLLRRPSIDAHEVRDKLIELQDLILNAQMVLGDAQEENRQLKVRITELERFHDISVQFDLDQGVYWYRGYPYCINCWDADRKPILLEGPYRIANTSGSVAEREWVCPIHKTKFHLVPRRA